MSFRFFYYYTLFFIGTPFDIKLTPLILICITQVDMMHMISVVFYRKDNMFSLHTFQFKKLTCIKDNSNKVLNKYVYCNS